MTAQRTAKGTFLPGHTVWQGSGGGRKPLPEDLKNVQRLAPEHLELLITKMLGWTQAEFTAHLTDPSATMLDMMVGAVMRKGILDGDPKYLDFIANKLLWRERAVPTNSGIDVVDTLKEVPKETLISFLKDRAKVTA